MTPAEAAALLTIAAAFDNRKPDADQARAWAMALDGLRYDDCRAAIVQHYQSSREWMMPADVRDRVKRLRRDRLSAFGTLPDPPADMDPSNTAIYHAWMVATTKAVADGNPPPARPALKGSENTDARKALTGLRRKADADVREGLTA